MQLTLAQRATVRAAVLADSTANSYLIAQDSYSLLIWLNAEKVPAVPAWRMKVSANEVYDAHKPVEYIARSAAERDAFTLMVCDLRNHDFTLAPKRNGVADIFSGVNNNTSRTLIFAIAQENASNAQAAVGGTSGIVGGVAGMAEIVTALVRTFNGKCDAEDVSALINNRTT